jgi:DNA processing protein
MCWKNGKIMTDIDEDTFLEENPIIQKIFPDDLNYPQRIQILAPKKILKPLFHMGEMVPFNGGVSVVGTRKCSESGALFAEEVGSALADSSIIVNSGLARGIDSFAHKGCVQNDGISIAVLAWFHKLYPPEHKSLLEKILERGCAISETLFMPESFPQSQFLKRDEIMAMISDVVVVVESKSKGGAKYTADYAKKKNIPVIKCKTDTDDAELIQGHKTFLNNGAIEATSPNEVIEIISKLKKKDNVQTNDSSLDAFLDSESTDTL